MQWLLLQPFTVMRTSLSDLLCGSTSFLPGIHNSAHLRSSSTTAAETTKKNTFFGIQSRPHRRKSPHAVVAAIALDASSSIFCLSLQQLLLLLQPKTKRLCEEPSLLLSYFLRVLRKHVDIMRDVFTGAASAVQYADLPCATNQDNLQILSTLAAVNDCLS